MVKKSLGLGVGGKCKNMSLYVGQHTTVLNKETPNYKGAASSSSGRPDIAQ